MGVKAKLDLLAPEARSCFDRFLAKLDERGIKYAVLETLRTPAAQEAYYAQGRRPLDEVNALRTRAGLYLLSETENRHTVTTTMKSIHLIGRAADIAPLRDGKIPWKIDAVTAPMWLELGRLGRESGLEWGGDWKPLGQYGIGWDAPHYQLSQ